eukprot:Gb_37335 [translate_table: standard]
MHQNTIICIYIKPGYMTGTFLASDGSPRKSSQLSVNRLWVNIGRLRMRALALADNRKIFCFANQNAFYYNCFPEWRMVKRTPLVHLVHRWRGIFILIC